jgi:RNA polymerase sigma-70 factor (ECF subfamily)
MSENDHEPSQGGGKFAATDWSMVVAAGDSKSPESQAALATLCRIYWPPVYSYIRRSGKDKAVAEDLTQAFFYQLLEKKIVRAADQTRGRFRSFLLTSVKNFLINEWDRDQAKKRGEGNLPIRLDADVAEAGYRIEPANDVTPERAFETRWAQALLDRVLERLGDEMNRAGQKDRFEILRPFIVGGAASSYAAVAADLGVGESAVKVAVHRMRKRYGALLRDEVARTVGDRRDIDGEIRYLLEAAGSF